MEKFLNIVFAVAVFGVVSLAWSCGGRGAGGGRVAGDTDDAVSAHQVIQLSDSILSARGADTIDMGRMKRGEVALRNINLINAGDKPLVLVNVDKSCGCVEVSYPKSPLKPGASGEMEIMFDSQGLIGWIYKTVGVQTSLSNKPYILVVTAEVE